MGRGQKRKKFIQKRNEKKSETDIRGEGSERTGHYLDIIKENENFCRYYKHMAICGEHEFNDFLASLRSDLPVTFRISGSKYTSKRLLDLIQNEFFTKYISAADQSSKPIALPWIKDQMAWQVLYKKDCNIP